VSKYNHFDFYNADESAVANNDGTFTITVRAAAAAAPLGAGASLALGFTVTSDNDQDVTLAETVLIAGGAANSGNTGTSTVGAGSETGTPSGATTGSTAGTSTSSSGSSRGGTATGGSRGSTTTVTSGDLAVQIKLGSSWAGAYEGTITVLNGGGGSVPAGWSVSFTSRQALGTISDFSVQQQALADGSYRVTLSAPAWAAAQPLAAGARLSSYCQASANLSGQTVSDLFQFSTPPSGTGGSAAGGCTAGSSTASGTATSGSGLGTSSTGSTDPGSTATITAVADNVGLVQGNLAPAAISDDSTPTISGSLSAALSTGESLRIFNGSTLLGIASVNNTAKTWSFTPTALVNNGSYSISARVADAAGNLGSPSASFAFSLDTNPAPSTPGSGGSGNATKRVVGYFEEWGIYGGDSNVADVKAGQLTNLNYSFFGITPTQADRPYMAAELNVLPGDWAGGLGIHDPWAAYEKTFTQADQLVSRRFETTEWQEIGDGRRQRYLTGGDFNVSANADGSCLVMSKPDSWKDSQGGAAQLQQSRLGWPQRPAPGLPRRSQQPVQLDRPVAGHLHPKRQQHGGANSDRRGPLQRGQRS